MCIEIKLHPYRTYRTNWLVHAIFYCCPTVLTGARTVPTAAISSYLKPRAG